MLKSYKDIEKILCQIGLLREQITKLEKLKDDLILNAEAQYDRKIGELSAKIEGMVRDMEAYVGQNRDAFFVGKTKALSFFHGRVGYRSQTRIDPENGDWGTVLVGLINGRKDELLRVKKDVDKTALKKLSDGLPLLI